MITESLMDILCTVIYLLKYLVFIKHKDDIMVLHEYIFSFGILSIMLPFYSILIDY